MYRILIFMALSILIAAGAHSQPAVDTTVPLDVTVFKSPF